MDPKTPVATEPPKPEVRPAEGTPQPDKQKDNVAARFAFLSKKEKALALREADIKNRQEALSLKAKSFEDLEKTKQGAKSNPLAYLEAAGLTYEDLTGYVLNDKRPPADLGVKAVKDELEAFKKQQSDELKRLVDEQKQRAATEEKAAIERFERECLDFVKANSVEYELTNQLDAGNLVVEVIQQNFARTQRVMSAKEAAVLVEKYLEEQVEKAAATKKWQARAQQKQSSPPSPVESQRPDPAQQKTLNNGLTASTPAFQSQQIETDRMKRALAALEGKKN